MAYSGTITAFPYGVSSYGIPIIGSGGGIPLTNTGGQYWFVSSTLGSNGNPGTFSSPFATLAYALANASLKINDTIVVEEGHTETVAAAAGLLANVAGVNIIGQGSGTSAPTFTFATATTATFRITAAGVTVQGLKFVTGIDSLATIFDIRAKSVVIQNNVFQDNGTNTGLSFIDFVGVTANAADYTKILNNYFYNPTAGNFNHAIGLTTVQDNIEIGGNYIVGSFALSNIHNITGKVVTNINIHDNYVRNLTASKPALNFISAVTGKAYRNNFVSGANVPSAAIFGTALDASGNNTGNNGSLNAGGEFILYKQGIVCSTITQAGLDLTIASIGGPILIKGGVVQTDGTGLAGMTNFTMVVNNSDGLLTFFSQAITGLGANKTLGFGSLVGTTAPATAGFPTVLESGKKVTLKATVADGTGAGVIDVYLLCQRLTAGANVALV